MKAFSNFELVFQLLAANRKKYSNQLEGVNIDQIAMCYISIDLVSMSSTN